MKWCIKTGVYCLVSIVYPLHFTLFNKQANVNRIGIQRIHDIWGITSSIY